MNNLSWLSKICHPDYVDDSVRGIFGDSRGRPFSLTLDGQPWAVATNGHMLVAVAGENGFPSYLSAWEGLIGVIENFLRSHVSGSEISLKQLKRWCGKPQHNNTCSICGGVCDFPLPVRRGWIGNVLINREALAQGLKPFSDSTVRVAIAGRWDPLIVSGDRWRVVLMPMAGERDPLDAMLRVDRLRALGNAVVPN